MSAEEERLELSRHLAMTYRFSKPAPSPTWVLLQKRNSEKKITFLSPHVSSYNYFANYPKIERCDKETKMSDQIKLTPLLRVSVLME